MDRADIGVKEPLTSPSRGEMTCSRPGFGIYSGNAQTRCKQIMNRQLAQHKLARSRQARRERHTPGSRFFPFLKRLRAAGRSNMYGAIPYLMRTFALDREAAFRVVCEWEDVQAAERSEATVPDPRR
jgi:hypothetical protein